MLSSTEDVNQEMDAHAKEVRRIRNVRDRIQAVSILRERNRHLSKDLRETSEKLAIHEHYMRQTQRLERNVGGMVCDNYENRMKKEIECLLMELEDSIAKKEPATN